MKNLSLMLKRGPKQNSHSLFLKGRRSQGQEMWLKQEVIYLKAIYSAKKESDDS